MDIKIMVVGQGVVMVSGCYCCQGKVVKVTSGFVEVEVIEQRYRTGPYTMILKFDKDGNECTFDKQKYPNAWMGTYECGPWKLTNATRLSEL